jgi:hypothetical protein
MLGYVKPNKPELKIKEYECYKGFYCSLCKALGKKYGLFSRLFLSFDVTFFLIFLFSVQNEKDLSFRQGRCPFNPLKKCNYLDINSSNFDFAAAFTVIMTFYKVRDNIKDESFFKRLKYILVYPLVRFKYKKALKLYPQIDEIIKASVAAQNKLETEKCNSADMAAEPSAKALAESFALFAKSEEEKALFWRFGYCLGRFVYLTDAFDDYEKDKKHGSYNVFVINGYSKEQMLMSVRMSISEAINILGQINLNANKSIVENIVFEGLESELSKIIIKKEGVKNGKKSV